MMPTTTGPIDPDQLLLALANLSMFLLVGLLVEPWVGRLLPAYRCRSHAERGALLGGLLYGGITLPYLLLFFRVAVRLREIHFIYGLGIACLCLSATIPHALYGAHRARCHSRRETRS